MGNLYQFVFTLTKTTGSLPVVNRLKERMGYTSKIVIFDETNRPRQCHLSPQINTIKLNIIMNLAEGIHSVSVLPMVDSGCILQNLQVLVGGKPHEYTSSCYKKDDLSIFLSSSDTIMIKNSKIAKKLQIIADIIYN